MAGAVQLEFRRPELAGLPLFEAGSCLICPIVVRGRGVERSQSDPFQMASLCGLQRIKLVRRGHFQRFSCSEKLSPRPTIPRR